MLSRRERRGARQIDNTVRPLFVLPLLVGTEINCKNDEKSILEWFGTCSLYVGGSCCAFGGPSERGKA